MEFVKCSCNTESSSYSSDQFALFASDVKMKSPIGILKLIRVQLGERDKNPIKYTSQMPKI